jgi:hypothetical protein
MVGLGSLGVGLSVDQVRASVVAHLGLYKFAGERAHHGSLTWTWRCEETEVGGGLYANVRETVNSARGSSPVT